MLKRPTARITAVALALFFHAGAFAQSPSGGSAGWEAIRQNDNKTARIKFADELKKDSTNRFALEGMLYLSELEGDELGYKRYVNTLLKNHWNGYDYELYAQRLHIADKKAVLNQAKLPERYKLPLRIEDAYVLKLKDEHDKAYSEFRKYTHDFSWSVIGPFKNTEGSGYAKAYPVETDNFDASREYQDAMGMPLKWSECRYRKPDGALYFDYYLPNSSSGVYYANTFIETPQTQLVQLRISRKFPIKIWLDGALVFNSRDKTTPATDLERVQFQVPAGSHRLMVKYAKEERYYDFSSMFGAGVPGKFSASTVRPEAEYDEVMPPPPGMDHSYRAREAGFDPEPVEYLTNGILLRFTDTSGQVVSGIKSSFNGSYTKGNFNVQVSENELIRHYQNRVRKDMSDLYAWYALELALEKYGQTNDGEEMFVKAFRKQPNSVFFKYLAAKLYMLNEKEEKYYSVMNDIDQDKTPVFDLLYHKLTEKDQQNDEEEWFAALENLNKVSPGNMMVLSSYISYYDNKGMKKEKEEYIKKAQTAYPEYKEVLQYYLDQDKKAKYENEEDASDSKLSKRYGKTDYAKLQEYKRKGKVNKALAIYDKFIQAEPYDLEHRTDKAQYLLDKDKHEESKTELRKAVDINPYNISAYEMMGDVFKDKEEKDSALFYYKKAKYLATRSNTYRMGELDDKIKQVVDEKPLKKLFQTPTFEEVLADDSWQEKYSDEESVVLMYSRDLALDEFNHANLYQKIMIKILTEAGVNRWTEFNFGFLGEITMAKVIKVNGAEIVPDMSQGYTVFKDLKPGDLIEIEGKYDWQPSGELDNELNLVSYFTFDAPIHYAKFEVAVPKGRYLGYKLHKLQDNLKRETKDGFDFYTWKYSGLNKAEREEGILDEYDLYSSIMLSTLKDWSKVVNWYTNTTYRKLEASYEVKEVLDSIIKPGMSQQQKVTAIYNYLTKDIKYSFVPFLQSGYVPKRCGLTLSSRIGDCKDVATVMVTMLREAGIPTFYTLVKTNMMDHQHYLPSTYFDHVIAGYYLGDSLHFADMTTDFYPAYVMTEGDVDADALLIKDGTTELMRLPKDNLNPKKNLVEIKVDAEIKDDRSATMKVRALHPGIAGGDIRETFSRISQAEQRNYIMDKLGKGVFQNMVMEDYDFENLKEIDDTLRSSYKLQAGGYCDVVAKLLIFRTPFMTAIRTSQALLADQRFNRLNVAELVQVEPTRQVVNIRFPKGYQLIEVPENISLKSRFGEYQVKYRKIKDGLQVEKYQAFFTQEVAVEDFEAFREYYFRILDADGTRMAIQKQRPAAPAASASAAK